MTSDHDMLGMLRGARKRLRRNGWRHRHLHTTHGQWVESQTRLWRQWELMLERAHKQGVVSDVGLDHLRNRENVIRENWGCKP